MDQGIKLTAAALFLLTVCSPIVDAQSGVCKFQGSYSIGLAVSSIQLLNFVDSMMLNRSRQTFANKLYFITTFILVAA